MRPYIYIEKIGSAVLQEGKKATIDVSYANFGSSPAVSIAIHSKIVLGKLATEIALGHVKAIKIDRDVIKMTPIRKPTEISVVIMGTKNNYFTALSDVLMTDSDIDYLKTHDGGWALLASFEYFDTKGNRYSTKYCRFGLVTGAKAECFSYNQID
jgi:hypothetical protein